jgi:hypothetical protein
LILVVDRPSQGAATLFGAAPAYRWTSAWLQPGERSRLYVYLGSATNLEAGRPSVGPDPQFNETSAAFWQSLRPIAARRPVLVVMASFTTHFHSFVARHPGAKVAPGVAIQNGPIPSRGAIRLARLPDPPQNSSLVISALVTLVALAVAGLGWSASLLPIGWLERVACAPAFGIASMALGGLAADRLGLRLTGGSGVGVALVVAVLGWAPLTARVVGDRMRPAKGRGMEDREDEPDRFAASRSGGGNGNNAGSEDGGPVSGRTVARHRDGRRDKGAGPR